MDRQSLPHGIFTNIISNTLVFPNTRRQYPPITVKDIPSLEGDVLPLTRGNHSYVLHNLTRVENVCSLARSSIKVNGVEIGVSKGAGHCVIALNMKGVPIQRRHYNTKEEPSTLKNVVKDLRRLPDDVIVIIATQVTKLFLELFALKYN